MIDSLLQAFNLVEKPVKKEQLLKTFNTISSMAQEDLLPSLTEIKDVEKSQRVAKSELYVITKDVMKTKSYKSKSIFQDLESIFLDLDKNKSKIENLITKHTSSVLTNKVLSVKDAAIIKFVDDISSLTMYSADFITCVLANVKDTAFPKVKFKKLKENIPAFVDLIKAYDKDISKSIEKISKLDDSTLTKDTNKAFMEMKLKNDGALGLFPQGFINNPFYHIRMWLIDRDIAKLEALKDKKRLIELRIMELKIDEKSGEDGDLTKQIEYYEEKLSAIEYKIEKLEAI